MQDLAIEKKSIMSQSMLIFYWMYSVYSRGTSRQLDTLERKRGSSHSDIDFMQFQWKN